MGLDLSKLRKGATAIQEAQERAKSRAGDFTPFTPSLFWGEGDERYVLFLNSMEDIPTIDQMIGFVPINRKGMSKPIFENVIARTDKLLGESEDPMVKEWGADPKEQCLAVAVELEPKFQEVKGRKRPVGFEVATREYERRIRDEEGELTDETETVVQPVVGFITQSPYNFFNLISSTDATEGAIDSTPLKIKRVDKNTYQVTPYVDQEVDLGDLLEYIDGLSYLGDEVDDVVQKVDEAETDQEAAAFIGSFLLDKRIHELADRERYDKLFQGIDRPFRYGTKEKKASEKTERPKRERQSRRNRKSEDADKAESAGEAESAPPEEPDREDRLAALRKRAEKRQRTRETTSA